MALIETSKNLNDGGWDLSVRFATEAQVKDKGYRFVCFVLFVVVLRRFSTVARTGRKCQQIPRLFMIFQLITSGWEEGLDKKNRKKILYHGVSN